MPTHCLFGNPIIC